MTKVNSRPRFVRRPPGAPSIMLRQGKRRGRQMRITLVIGLCAAAAMPLARAQSVDVAGAE
ncbi:MAG TPA: hypothetical protein VM756_02955, partial [Burkholderiales bacterium]|nr:hypothetical protein [Burkholderiales bacterium]